MIEVNGVPQGSLSHSGAKADCESRGGRLAILNTAEKQAAAVAAVPTGWAAWIGGEDTDGDCTHHWSDGTEVAAPGTSTAENFENWHGNPQCSNSDTRRPQARPVTGAWSFDFRHVDGLELHLPASSAVCARDRAAAAIFAIASFATKPAPPPAFPPGLSLLGDQHHGYVR